MILVRERRGVALMLVLWLIVVLGAIAVGVGALARGEANVVGNVRTRAAARYAAESGVLATRLRLQRALRLAQTPQDRVLVFRRFAEPPPVDGEELLGAARFQTVVVNLNARLDLNGADTPMLVAFLGQFVGPQRADALADALQDWTDADDLVRPHGAEAGEYARAGSPFRPTNRPLASLNELPRILGFSDSLATRLAPYVTVQSDGRVDVNAAPGPVLAAVAGVGPAGAQLLVSERARGTIFDSPAIAWSALQRAGNASGAAGIARLTTVPRRVLIVSRGWETGRPLTHEIQAVFDVAGLVLTLRFWTERDL